jgi:uncharacterized protein
MQARSRLITDVAFSAAVKAAQSRKGSRERCAAIEDEHGWPTRITPDLAAFIAAQSSVFLATASAGGQPYIQHRGGPAGFLRVIDERTLGFADFVGNRQYITTGNLAENRKAQLFLIDYAARRRIKIWGEACTIEDDAGLIRTLMPEGYRAEPEQAIVFAVTAWSENCPQHIPQRLEAAELASTLQDRDRRIAALEAELARLRAGVSA